MPLLKDTEVDQPEPPPVDPGDDEGDGGGGGTPWWQQAWKLVVLGLAVLFLGGAIGYAITKSADEAATPDAGSVDVGFLQDMRWHHDQAVRMAFVMLDKPAAGQDPRVRSVATDILRTQQFEAGVMAGQLRAWGQDEANTSGTGMAWMGMPIPIDRMPGMATDEQIEQLKSATGRDADLLFLQLMNAHHQGGLHMAIEAQFKADSQLARDLAGAIVKSQEFEIGELTTLTNALNNGA
jgi:uncharacterized protein (DUF305 family)